MGKNNFLISADSGKKYGNNILGSYLLENGIVNYSSHFDTPQQNGLVEKKKNKHLL